MGDCSNIYGTCHRRQSFIHDCQAEKTFIKKGYRQKHLSILKNNLEVVVVYPLKYQKDVSQMT